MLCRYELSDAKNSATSEHVLEVWCYEAYRLFRDRLVGVDACNRFDNIMATVVRSEWSANVFDNIASNGFIRTHNQSIVRYCSARNLVTLRYFSKHSYSFYQLVQKLGCNHEH